MRLVNASIKRPRLTLSIAAGLILLTLPGLLLLELRTDGHALVPGNDPFVRLDRKIREHFGLRDPIVVLLTTAHADGIFNAETVARVQQLSDAFAEIESVGVEQVTSLATERRDRVRPGTFEFLRYLQPLPRTKLELALLRADVEAAEILTGTLVSADRNSAAILVGVPAGGAHGERTRIYQEIQRILAADGGAIDRTVVVGAPVAEALLGQHILQDLSRLLPLAIAVIAAIVWIGCRRLWGVALGLAEVGGCLLVTFGIMGLCGVPVYLTTAVLPVILTTVGLADEIHVLWRYQHELADGDPTRPNPHAVVRSMQRIYRPVVLTSLTTAIGFTSFLLSGIEPVRMFGLFAAVGVVVCLLWTLTCMPAALTLLAAARLRRPQPRSVPRRSSVGFRLLTEHPLLLVSVVLVASMGASLGLGRLYIQDSWIDGFAEGSSFRIAVDHADEQLLGTHLLLVSLSFDLAALHRPEILRGIGQLESDIRSLPGVGGVLGPYSHLTEVNFLWNLRRDGSRALPETVERVVSLLETFDRARGSRRRREVIDDEGACGVMTVFLERANFRDTSRLMQAIRERAAGRLHGTGVRLDFAGDVAVSQATIPAIVRTEISSLLLALVSSFILVSLLLRSWTAALQALLPASLAVLWVLGGMGLLGIPLGVASSMFCAITFGIGIDYSMHFLEALRHARRAGCPQPADVALADVGPAIVFDTLAIAIGFGLLAFSSVPANALLGLLVSAGLAITSFLTLGGLSALTSVAHRFPPRRAVLVEERS